MEKVIGGLLYSTADAEHVCDVSGHRRHLAYNDFNKEETDLYRTSSGRYFLAGRGNALSRWATMRGRDLLPGSGIKPISEDEAKALVEEHSDAATFRRLFGEPKAA